jgi:hypothetical protein
MPDSEHRIAVLLLETRVGCTLTINLTPDVESGSDLERQPCIYCNGVADYDIRWHLYLEKCIYGNIVGNQSGLSPSCSYLKLISEDNSPHSLKSDHKTSNMGTLRVLILDHFDSYTNNILKLLQGSSETAEGVSYPHWSPVVVRFNQYSWQVKSTSSCFVISAYLELQQDGISRSCPAAS